MSSQQSTESILRQLSSGILSGSVVGTLMGRGHYILSYLTFTSIGLIDVAYHFNYLKAHITHLTYDQSSVRRDIRSRFNNLQRNIQRELRDPMDDDTNQELQWLWDDIKKQIDTHIFYGMGFSMAFLLSVILVPKIRR